MAHRPFQPQGLVPLNQSLLTVMSQIIPRMVGLETFHEDPPSVRHWFCQAEAWPAPSSRIGRLVEALREPGADAILLNYVRRTLTEEVSKALRFMPYEEFLGTQYWWLVRGLLLHRRGFCCEDCARPSVLDVHHVTYEHRGSEIFHLEDLRLVCRSCHMARHTSHDVES